MFYCWDFKEKVRNQTSQLVTLPACAPGRSMGAGLGAGSPRLPPGAQLCLHPAGALARSKESRDCGCFIPSPAASAPGSYLCVGRDEPRFWSGVIPKGLVIDLEWGCESIPNPIPVTALCPPKSPLTCYLGILLPYRFSINCQARLLCAVKLLYCSTETSQKLLLHGHIQFCTKFVFYQERLTTFFMIAYECPVWASSLTLFCLLPKMQYITFIGCPLWSIVSVTLSDVDFFLNFNSVQFFIQEQISLEEQVCWKWSTWIWGDWEMVLYCLSFFMSLHYRGSVLLLEGLSAS